MSSSPACADDPDRVFVSLGPRDNNDLVSYRADRDEAIFLLEMLLIEDLEVLCAGKKQLLRLFKADVVFVAVLKVLSLIPLDLHAYGEYRPLTD